MSWKLSKSENDTSVTLDFLRALAAFAVFFGHAIDFMGVGFAIKPPNAPYMQNFGVLIFFTLSGFLIAYTLNRSESSGESFASYLINRVARIYSGFLPCFVFIIVFSLILVNLNLHPIPEQVNWFVAIVNLLMLNGPPLSTLMPQIGVPFGFPNYPLAGQLWTLPAEFHLYIFVGGLYYFFKRGSLFALILAALFFYFPNFYLQFGPTGAHITLLWIGGFFSYFAGNYLSYQKYNKSVLLTLLVILSFITLSTVIPSQEYDLRIYPYLIIIFMLILILTQSTIWLVKHPKLVWLIRYFADFSFSLYLIHYPILYIINLNTEIRGWSGLLIIGLLIVVLAIILSHIGERHHKRLAKVIKQSFKIV